MREEEVRSTLVINVGGRIDGLNADEFHDSLDQKTQDIASNTVILDCEKLSYISSAGLRSILLTARNLKGKNKTFILCSLPDTAMEIIKISGFDKVFEIHESRSAAVAAAVTI